jgi:hypothetical protein
LLKVNAATAELDKTIGQRRIRRGGKDSSTSIAGGTEHRHDSGSQMVACACSWLVGNDERWRPGHGSGKSHDSFLAGR